MLNYLEVFWRSTFIVKLLVTMLVIIVGAVLVLLVTQLLVSLTDFSQTLNPRDAALTLAAIVGFPFLVWRSIIAAKQATISAENLTTSLIERAVRGLSADKVLKEPLGERREPNVEARIGALLQLERISRLQASSGTRQGRSDHIQIMKIICAYIRENSHARVAVNLDLPEFERYTDELSNDGQLSRALAIDQLHSTTLDRAKELRSEFRLRTDIATAMDVLGRRTVDQLEAEHDRSLPGNMDGYKLDLSYSNLQCLDLSFANLDGTNLSGSKLDGSKLSSCFFRSVDFTDASLKGCDIKEAIFSGSKLIGTSFIGAEVFSSRFENCSSIASSFAVCQFHNCSFSGCSFSSTDFEGSSAIGADFSNCKFQNAEMIGANFSHSNFFNAHLYNNNIYGSELDYCDLRNTDWIGSNRPARISAVIVHYSDIRGGKITQEILEKLVGNKATLLPDDNAETQATWVNLKWKSEPLHYTTLVETRKRLGLRSDLVREVFEKGQPKSGLRTGTPWPLNENPPWVKENESCSLEKIPTLREEWMSVQNEKLREI